eukprot:TRINITY_DN9118_c0_g1_i5.p2 TRINITY_DN9118_c0_g1~~TRINITY_DN9118_c0_g1_i5.p2  ORF type:complete len:178 (+),score=32.50 TRINITY_DN9118_c0_g1_i5:196-729(+)
MCIRDRSTGSPVSPHRLEMQTTPAVRGPCIDALDIGQSNGPALLHSPPASPSSGGILFNKWKQKCLYGLLHNNAKLLREGLTVEGADLDAYLECEEEEMALAVDDQPMPPDKRMVGFFPQYLLQEGAGQTMLHYAASHDFLDLCRVLLEAGAKSNLKSLQGQTVAQVAQGSCCDLFK